MNMWEFLNNNWFWFELFAWFVFFELMDKLSIKEENKRLAAENERLKSRLDSMTDLKNVNL